MVGTPVYRASYTGALKHVFDLAASETRRQLQRVRISDLAKESSRKARAS